jgi:hypothetical protein
MAGMPNRETAPRRLRPSFAALAALAVALAVAALATPAHGGTADEAAFADSGPEASSFVVDADESGDEFEVECVEEDEESEAAEEVEGEGDEAEEECDAEAQVTDSLPPEECLLRTARARVFASSAHDRVRLVLSYTALSPTEVTVEYRLRGGKGSLRLGEVSKRFGQRGVFRASATLSEPQMDRVRAAKSFEVQLHVPGAPAFCNRYYAKHLTIRHGGSSQAVWSEADSSES